MRHVLMLGETGAGKTSLTKFMLVHFPKVLVLDRHWEYPKIGDPTEDFEQIHGFDAFATRVTSDVHATWRIAFRTDIDAEWGAAVDLVYYVQREMARSETATPILIVVEEIGLFSSPQKCPQWLANLWNYGRHYGITAVGICRVDTETHSVLRLNSTLCFFRSSEVTGKVAKGMTAEAIRELAYLDLYEWNTSNPPRPGVNYVTFPDVGDILVRLNGRERIRVVAG